MNEFIEAIKMLFRRRVTPSTLTSAQWQEVAPAIRQKAFFSSTINSANALTAWREMLLDWLAGATEEITMPDGSRVTAYKEVSLAKFRERGAEYAIREGLASAADFPDQSMSNVISNARLALVFNTNTEQAQEFAYWKERVSSTAYLNRFPAAKFVRRPGGNPEFFRQRHVMAEGEVRRWDDLSFWLSMNREDDGGFGVPWGPWGYNSYMRQEPVKRSTAERMGLVQPGEKMLPPKVKSYGGDLGSEFIGDYYDEMKDVPEDIRSRAKQRLVDRLGPEVLDSNGTPSLKSLREARKRLRVKYS